MPRNSITERITLLREALAPISHGRHTLQESRSKILYGHISQRGTVTRVQTPGSRQRISLGRSTARHRDDGILVAVGVPALRGDILDGVIPEAGVGPSWDTGAQRDELGHPAILDHGLTVLTGEDTVLDHVTADDAPAWCTQDRIASDWVRVLDSVLDDESTATMGDSSTLSTLSMIRLIRNSAIGHVEYSPALGRDGRVSLPDAYTDVRTVVTYTPEESMCLPVDAVRERAEQNGSYDVHHRKIRAKLPDAQPPTNGFLEG